MSSLGATLRSARQRARLSVRQLCKLSGVSPATISRLENGWENVTLDVMRELTHALRLDIDIWFRREPEDAQRFSCAPLADCDEPIVVGAA